MVSFDEGNGAEPFSIPVRVYIEDTDIGGIVFYANYLKYFERARTEFFRSKGHQFRDSFEQRVSYVVHSLSIKYLKSAKLDDEIKVFAEVVNTGKTYLDFVQKAVNEVGELLAVSEVKVACVDLDTGKPKRLSAELVACLG